MNFSIIGCGMIASFHAKAINAMENGTLYAIHGIEEEALKKIGEEYGCKTFLSLEEMLADEQVDIVTIATPSGTHGDLAIQSVKAGKHVICEKPLDVTTEKIDKVIQAAKENNKVVAGILNRRFNPVMEIAKEAVSQNRLGKLTLCDAYVKWYRDENYYASGAWRGTWALDGGGALMNQSIHAIDQLIYLAGDVHSIQASITNVLHKGIEVEDTAVAIVEFKSGARGVIEGSTACWSSTGHPAEIQLCGSEGSIFISDEDIKVWDFKNEKPEDKDIRQKYSGTNAQGLGANDPSAINFIGHQKNFSHVVDSIKKGVAPSVDAIEARKSVAIIRAVYESAQNEGKKIYL